MSENADSPAGDGAGLDNFINQLQLLHGSLDKVAKGMDALGNSAVRQGEDTENLAAHVLAIEALLTVMLRQIPVDAAEVREEAQRRGRNPDGTVGERASVVAALAEDILKRADD